MTMSTSPNDSDSRSSKITPQERKLIDDYIQAGHIQYLEPVSEDQYEAMAIATENLTKARRAFRMTKGSSTTKKSS